MDLSDKQIRSINESTKRFNIWVGAVRSGKTYASIRRLLDLLKNGPKGDVMIIGVSRATIQRNILNELYGLLGAPAPTSKCMETRLYGRNVYFVGANDESCVRSIQGVTLSLAYVDEITCLPEPFWRMLGSRLSVKGAQLLGTCNPSTPSHWLKKLYIDRAGELDLIHWHFTLDDNPSLDEAYKENLKKEYQGTHWHKRFIEGLWAAATGMVFDDFDEDNLFTDRMDTPSYYVAAIDYGTINATCCLLGAISPTRWPQIRIEEEYYYDSQKTGRTKSDAELAQDIKRFLSWRRVNALYIDPAAASLKVELRNLDLPVIDAKNDVLPGIQVVNKFVCGKNLVIHRSCKNLIEQMQSYQWDPKSIERGVDKPLKIQDHANDACRYLCYSAFPQGQFNSPDESLTIEQIRRNVYGGEDLLGINQGFGGYS